MTFLWLRHSRVKILHESNNKLKQHPLKVSVTYVLFTYKDVFSHLLPVQNSVGGKHGNTAGFLWKFSKLFDVLQRLRGFHADYIDRDARGAPRWRATTGLPRQRSKLA